MATSTTLPPTLPSSETSPLVSLANSIKSQVLLLQKHLSATGQPNPRFEGDSKLVEWEGVDGVRSACIENLTTLMDLLMTSRELVMGCAATHLASRQVLDRFGIYSLVPLEGRKTYAELAEEVKLPEKTLRRIMRHAIAQRIFWEPAPNVVAHTQASRLLAEDANMRDHQGIITGQVWPAAPRLAEALQSPDPDECAYRLAHGRKVYETLAQEPAVQKRYDSAMGLWAKDRGMFGYLAGGFDWGSLGGGEGVVVDMGGGKGNSCLVLAKTFPGLRFVVQDREDVIKDVRVGELEEGIRDRIEFQVHDFFTEQKVKGADLYFFRRVMMEWNHDQAVQMIKNLRPALKKGAIVQIQDPYLGAPGFHPIWQERRYRDSDMLALALENCDMREEEDWKAIFEDAGPGFEFEGARTAKGTDIAFIEAVWAG